MRVLRTLVILLLLPAVSLAGPNRWTASGPEAGGASRVYVSPIDANTAFAITAAGLYRSSDGGRSWHPVARQMPVDALTIAPDGTLFAVTASRVFESSDAGDHWTDRGNPASALIHSVAFDPKSNRLLLATDGSSAIFTSSDAGATWVTARLPDGLSGKVIGVPQFAVSATAVYAIAAENNSTALLRSDDGGQTWTAPNTAVPIGRVFADPSTPWVYAMYLQGAGVVVSKDETKSWTDVPVPATGAVTAVPKDASVFLAMEDEVYVYNDGATASQPIGQPIQVQDLAVSSSTPRRFYGAPVSGVVTFTEGDARWVENHTGLPGGPAHDVDLSAIQPSTAYATTTDGVFRTDDGGQSWIRLNISGNSENGVTASPATPNTAFVFSIFYGTGVFKTADAGTTWKEVSPAYTTALAIARSDPKTLYAALSTNMYKSTDGGETWSVDGSGLPAPSGLEAYYGVFYISSMAIDPSSSSHVLIGRDGGVYKTTNGSDWSRISTRANVRGLTIDASNPSTVYGTGTTYGVIKSTDGGASWQPAGLLDKLVQTIVQAGSALFAGTTDGHIYRSDDGAKSWNGFDDGIGFGTVARIVADPGGTHLYAATATGVYSYDVGDENIALQPIDNNPARLSGVLGQSFLIPVGGTVRGAGGTLYTTELMLTNSRSSPQSVLITRLPRAGESGVASFTATVPAMNTLKLMDLSERLGTTGIGSLVITAIDSAGNADPNGSIDASTVIWSYPAGGVAPVSQTIPPANASSFAAHSHSRASGMQQDARYHTNAGIVNLSGEAHQFTIQITGERTSSQFTIEVPAFSMLQAPLPPGDYGRLTIDGFADTSDVRWLLYGSSVDASAGQAQTILGSPVN